MKLSETTQIFRKPQVLDLLGISKSTLHERINEGLLPKPLKLGARSVGWYSHEIQKIILAMGADLSDDEFKAYVADMEKQRQVSWERSCEM